MDGLPLHSESGVSSRCFRVLVDYKSKELYHCSRLMSIQAAQLPIYTMHACVSCCGKDLVEIARLSLSIRAYSAATCFCCCPTSHLMWDVVGCAHPLGLHEFFSPDHEHSVSNHLSVGSRCLSGRPNMEASVETFTRREFGCNHFSLLISPTKVSSMYRDLLVCLTR